MKTFARPSINNHTFNDSIYIPTNLNLEVTYTARLDQKSYLHRVIIVKGYLHRVMIVKAVYCYQLRHTHTRVEVGNNKLLIA